MLKRLFILALCLTAPFSFSVIAQSDTLSNGEVFDYEKKQRDVIATYEGFPPVPFEAPDIDGDMHMIHELKDKVVILQFQSIWNQPDLTQIPSLNRLADEYSQQGLFILGLSDDTKEELVAFRDKNPVHYPLVPNSRGLGEMAFAAELGYPRIFLIDKFGVIRKVITGNSSTEEMSLYEQLKPLVEKYIRQ